MTRRANGERGATVLEFALVFPVFLAVTGLMLFGAWLGVAKAIVDHGAREGARFAAIPSGADLRAYPSAADVASKVNAATPLLDPTGVTVTSGTGGAARGAPMIVHVTYTVANPARALFAPLRIFGWGDVSPTITITADAQVRRE